MPSSAAPLLPLFCPLLFHPPSDGRPRQPVYYLSLAFYYRITTTRASLPACLSICLPVCLCVLSLPCQVGATMTQKKWLTSSCHHQVAINWRAKMYLVSHWGAHQLWSSSSSTSKTPRHIRHYRAQTIWTKAIKTIYKYYYYISTSSSSSEWWPIEHGVICLIEEERKRAGPFLARKTPLPSLHGKCKYYRVEDKKKKTAN